MPEKEALDRNLPEHPKLLLDPNQLQGMFPRHVDGLVLQSKCRECSSELVSLIHTYHR